MNQKLAKTLNKMIVEDLKNQQKTKKTGIPDSRIFKINTKKLKLIIDQYGYPIISLVGKKANHSAWLITQHSDHDVQFQKKCLGLIKAIYKKNPLEINKQNIAFLEDRLLFNEGKKQFFGTQFYINKKGDFTYWPIKDSKNINQRRKQYNLPPFSVYLNAAKSVKQRKF